MVALAPRGGGEIGNVGAAVGLGDGKRTDLSPGEDLGKKACLERGCAGEGDGRRADGMALQARGNAARAGAGQFLRGDDAVEAIGFDAAIFLGKSQGKESDRGRLLVKRARKGLGFVPCCGMGLDLLLDEAAKGRAKGLVLRRVVGTSRRHGAHAAASGASSTSGLRVGTCSPGFTSTAAMVPSRGATISCSIFIASRMTRHWPFRTGSPARTRTAETVPVIGASAASPLAPAAAVLPASSTSSNAAVTSPKLRWSTSPSQANCAVSTRPSQRNRTRLPAIAAISTDRASPSALTRQRRAPSCEISTECFSSPHLRHIGAASERRLRQLDAIASRRSAER